MNYSETLDFLFKQIPFFQQVGSSAYKPGLQNTQILDDWCGNPHKQYPIVHIGGTNGKGSVSSLIASILQESGYKTGLYTSPHLLDFRERIRVNGHPIPETEVIRFVEDFRSNCKQVEPSFFELTTEMAFHWFAVQNVDIAIVEVGLGGRLDSTNIVSPIVTAVTNISFDHIAQLGNTLEQIAFEKAGIIKENIPLILGKTEHNTVLEVFRNQCEKHNAPLIQSQQHYHLQWTQEGTQPFVLQCEDRLHTKSLLPCALQGLYQEENVATVLCLVDELRNQRYQITEKNVKDGLSNVHTNTQLRGRWEYLSHQPTVICDTGHNVAGIQQVVKQLANTPHERLHMIIGMVNDKDVSGVLDLLPQNATYYFTKASIPRALPEEDLAFIARKSGLHGKTYPAVKEALKAAKKECRPNDLIFVGGSTFIVAEAL